MSISLFPASLRFPCLLKDAAAVRLEDVAPHDGHSAPSDLGNLGDEKSQYCTSRSANLSDGSKCTHASSVPASLLHRRAYNLDIT